MVVPTDMVVPTGVMVLTHTVPAAATTWPKLLHPYLDTARLRAVPGTIHWLVRRAMFCRAGRAMISSGFVGGTSDVGSTLQVEAAIYLQHSGRTAEMIRSSVAKAMTPSTSRITFVL